MTREKQLLNKSIIVCAIFARLLGFPAAGCAEQQVIRPRPGAASLTLMLAARGLSAVGSQRVMRTQVTLEGEKFLLNGRPTYMGRTWNGTSIEGRLMNARMVQGIFDDLNPDTRARWAYPDGSGWDPDRNTREFMAAMPEWRWQGLIAFTLNLQGGNPYGYPELQPGSNSKPAPNDTAQPWHNSAFTPDGTLRPDYSLRAARILDRADELGMVVILGLFYFGQDQRFADQAAVIRALDQATDWLLVHRWHNVLVEINNECDVGYHHAILKPARVHELIERVHARAQDGWRLLVGTSYGGGRVPADNVVRVSDFILMHANNVSDPIRIGEMVRKTRALPSWRPMPIVFNEDDHFDFDKPENNMTAALRAGASWGYFDYRKRGEGFADGYQSVPVDWGINSPRKRVFFTKLREITGGLE